jgi:YidC/Oxa1 family membrane protein insertase
MSAFIDVPVDAAYHLVSALAGALAPLPGGLAAPAAIVLVTLAVRVLLLPLSYRAMRGMEAQARIAPQVQALRKRLAARPDRLRHDLAGLYRAEGTSMYAGCLPALAQWPVLSVLYLLFRSPRVGGAGNALLTHDLFGAPLGSHWLGGAGPLSAQGAVFTGVFVLLAAIGWLSARLARRRAAPASVAGPAGRAPQDSVRAGRTPAADARAGSAAQRGAPAGGLPGDVQAGGLPGAVAGLAPFAVVAVAMFAPLAAGLYLVTTTAWTLGERALLRRPFLSWNDAKQKSKKPAPEPPEQRNP